MRVLVLTADLAPAQWSGIGTAVSHQIAALRALGGEVEVLTRERLAGPRFPIAVEDDDVVHLHSLSLAELALELTARRELPLVYTAHSLLDREHGARLPQWTALQRRVLDRADAVVFVSRAERDAALVRMPSLAARAHVIHNGVPTPPPPAPYDENGPIVFAGRFTRSKGFDLVLDLAASLGHEFVLAGGHGDRDLHARAEAIASAHPRCRLVGWLDPAELAQLFAAASLVLMPSRYEPFGMVALEAMSAGAPLVASAAGGLAEIVTAESGGRIVAAPNIDAWRDACAQRLADPAERRGPRYVAKHFDARAAASALLPLLHTALACRRSTI